MTTKITKPTCYLELLAMEKRPNTGVYCLPGVCEVYFAQLGRTEKSLVYPAPMHVVPGDAREGAENLRKIAEEELKDKKGGLNQGGHFLVWLYYAADIGAKGAFVAAFHRYAKYEKADPQWNKRHMGFVAKVKDANIGAHDVIVAKAEFNRNRRGLNKRFQAHYVIAWLVE